MEKTKVELKTKILIEFCNANKMGASKYLQKIIKDKKTSQENICHKTPIMDTGLFSKKLRLIGNEKFDDEDLCQIYNKLKLNESQIYAFNAQYKSEINIKEKQNKINIRKQERLSIEENFMNKEPTSKESHKVYNFLMNTPLFDIDFHNSSYNLEDCFFQEPVDYCIKLRSKDTMLFSTIPENCIVGIYQMDERDKYVFFQGVLEQKVDISNTLFYLAYNNDENKEYLITYLDIDKGGIFLMFENNEGEIIEKDIALECSEDTLVKIYPNGKEYKPLLLKLKDVEIFGYVKGYYKCQF